MLTSQSQQNTEMHKAWGLSCHIYFLIGMHM